MPVKELPMPPVKVQKQDVGGGVATYQPAAKGVPALALHNLKLNLN